MPGKTVGRHLQPNVIFKSISIDGDASGERSSSKQEVSVSWLCLPYFWLAPYSAGAPLQTTYPVKTLLQSWHMSTPRKREMRQAICDLNYPKEDHVFHVPQVWCLMLGDSKSCGNQMSTGHACPLTRIETLITCKPSQVTEPRWSWKRIRIQPASPQEDQPHLHVSDGGTRVWLLAVRSCLTWLV